MKKIIYTISLLGLLTTLSACSNEEQQQAAKEISHQNELEKAEQVQGIVDEKTAKDSQEIKKESNE
jgi:protein involved in sex pheromone biosynthesis